MGAGSSSNVTPLYYIVADSSKITLTTTYIQSDLTVPAANTAVRCEDRTDTTSIYRYIHLPSLSKLMNYVSSDIGNSWTDSNYNNPIGVACNNTSTGGNMIKKADVNVQCINDNNFYKYVSSQNNLYKYENQATALQYNSVAASLTDCDQFNMSRYSFTPTNTLGSNVPDGQAVRCTATQPSKVYRWTNMNLMEYPTQNVTSTWDANGWTGFNSYDCTNNLPAVGTMQNKPADNSVISCSDDGKLYTYSYANNNLTLYDNQSIVKQYIPNATIPNVSTDCRQFSSKRNIFSPNIPVSKASEGDAVKCLAVDQTNIYRYTGGKLLKYQDKSAADSWDPTIYANGNYKAYDCTNVNMSGVMQNRSGDGMTIQCSDNNYYRYQASTNQLLLYENQSVAIQYGGTLPANSIDCNQYGIPKGNFSSQTNLQANVTTSPDGKTVRCSDEPDITKRYRYNKSQNVLLQYPDDATAASWGAADYKTNYNLYTCGSVNRTGLMQQKLGTGSAVTCNNKLYRYDASANSLSFYPNASTFLQYNASWNNTISNNVNCSQFVSPFNTFTATIPLSATTANDGDSIVCNENNITATSATSNIERYNKSRDLLLNYNSNTTANTWNGNWQNYKSYTCGTNYTGNITSIDSKPSTNDVLQCKNDASANWYVYDGTTNSITQYPDKAVIRQYIPTADIYNTKNLNCNAFNFQKPILTQNLPRDNVTVTFENETGVNEFKDGIAHPYTDINFAQKNDANYSANINDPRNTMVRSMTNVGTPVKWPLNNYDIITCNQDNVNGYVPTDSYAYTTAGTIYKYPNNQPNLDSWISNKTKNPYYNCGTAFTKGADLTTNVPDKSQVIQCTNRTDTKAYSNFNVSGVTLTNNVGPVNSSSQYFKYNPTTDKFERYGSKAVLDSYGLTATPFSDCNALNSNVDDTLIMYPNPSANQIIKCINQSDSTFPYYKYDATNKKLNKYPVPDVAARLDPNYLSMAAQYDCSYINLQTNGTPLNYNPPSNGTIINCSNEPSSSFPIYKYDSSANTINRYKTQDVINSWFQSYTPQNYDCNYLTAPKGTEIGYKPPADTTTVQCANQQSDPFPYYRYNATSNMLNKYNNFEALFTWAPFNTAQTQSMQSVVNVSSYNCDYLTTNIGQVYNDMPPSDNMYIYCSNENTSKQLYIYNNLLIRPFNVSTQSDWNVKVQTIADCSNFIKGPPVYVKQMENNHSFMNDPFIESNRNGQRNYYVLNNDTSCNLIPNNGNKMSSNGNAADYDKYYSRTNKVSFYTDDICSNPANVSFTYSNNDGFNIGILKFTNDNDMQNTKYYKFNNTT